MFQKVFLLLCTLALARAGVIGTHFSPATSVSSVYSSINNAPAIGPIGTPIYQRTSAQLKYDSPAPIYESVESTHESNSRGLDGSQQTTYTKSLDTAFSSVKNYDTRVSNNGLLAHSVPTIYSAPIQTSYLYSPSAYTTSPLANSVLTKSISPITYTTHSATPIVTKFPSPIVTKTITPVTYASHEGQGVKTTITYSDAPLVSHMSFTGLGTSYTW